MAIEEVKKEEDELAEKEMGLQEKLEATLVTYEKIQKTIKKVEEKLEQEPKNRTLKKAKRQLEKDLLPESKNMKNKKLYLVTETAFQKQIKTPLLCA